MITLHLVLVFLHLMATCAAIGLMLATDLRLAASLWARARRPALRDAPLQLAPPPAFVCRVIGAALAVLLATGAGLVALALEQRPDALANPKLQAKLLLVGLLVLNAVGLHGWVFPALKRGRGRDPGRGRGRAGRPEPLGRLLARSRAPARWARSALWAAPVALSQALWPYCALLGIARPWNHVHPIESVLALAGVAFLVAWGVGTALLACASASSYRPVTAIPTLDVRDAPLAG